MQTTSVQITPADGCFCLACLDHDRRILLTARIATLAATSASCPSCAQIARLARAALEPSPRVDALAEAEAPPPGSMREASTACFGSSMRPSSISGAASHGLSQTGLMNPEGIARRMGPPGDFSLHVGGNR